MIKGLYISVWVVSNRKTGNLKIRKTEFLEFLQIASCVEYFCIFVKFLNNEGYEFQCLVELKW